MTPSFQRWACAIGLSLVLPPSTSATIAMSLDVLDGSDPGAPSPPGVVIVDVGIDVSSEEWFFSAGIVGSTFNGATIRYAQDPNQPTFPTFHPPGLDNRSVSFGSAAYGRNDPPRFAPAGTVAEQTILIAGGWYPNRPNPTVQPGELNISWWAFPPANGNDPQAPRGRDGFVIRVSIDITAVAVPGADDPANYRIFEPGQAPSGYLPVFVSEAPFPGGTWVSSQLDPDGDGRNWGLYIPEPSSVSMLLFVVLILSRLQR